MVKKLTSVFLLAVLAVMGTGPAKEPKPGTESTSGRGVPAAMAAAGSPRSR